MANALLRAEERASKTPARSGKPPLRPDIQGLRAVAVSLVVLSHAGVRQFSGGYTGVDVFFVISGFLITSLLGRELGEKGRISIGKFYARRALRLLPASTLVAVTTLAGAYLFLSKVRFEEYVGDAVSSALYVVNVRMAISGTNYLQAGSPPSPFQHFWSLAVEEQFYLVWPLLLMAAHAMGRRRSALRALLPALLVVVSFVVNIVTTPNSDSWAYFGSQTRVWELGAGALLALGAERLRRMPPPLAGALSWTGLVCVLGSALRFDDATLFPGYAALVPVVGAVLVLAGGCVPSRFGGELVLRQRPLVAIGGLSYGWYLWHWPLLVILPAALGRPASARTGLVVCAVALVLAWGTLRLVENPVRFHTAFRGRPRRALGLGLGLSACALAVSLIAALFPPAISSGRPASELAGALDKARDPGARLAQLLARANDVVPSNLSPGLTAIKGAESAVYQDGCHVDYASVEVKSCVYGDPASDTTVVLFGDSHAAQWFPALDRLARQHHWKLVSLTKASCKVADVTIISGGGPYSSCDTWRSKALARIARLRPALVIASSSDSGDPAHPAGDPVRQWTDGFAKTYRKLRESGARVAALLDTPWPESDAVDCAAANPLALSRCVSDPGRAAKDPDKATEIRAAAKAAGASVVDPGPWLCAPRVCPVVVGNTLVYRDDSHMAETYARALAPVVGDELVGTFGADLRGRG